MRSLPKHLLRSGKVPAVCLRRRLEVAGTGSRGGGSEAATRPAWPVGEHREKVARPCRSWNGKNAGEVALLGCDWTRGSLHNYTQPVRSAISELEPGALQHAVSSVVIQQNVRSP